MVKRTLETTNYKIPVKHGGTTLELGALLIPGTTAETNLGVAIVASGAAADAVGVLKKKYASTETDTLVAGTVWAQREVELIGPIYVLEREYDLADTAAVASTSGTTVTITSLEDNIDTSYLYAVSGTGAGSLYFIDTSASGSCTTKTATGWDSTTTVIKILRTFHQVAKLNTAADKIGTDAAAGSWTVAILGNYFRTFGRKSGLLDPTLHSGLTNFAATGAGSKFFAEVGVRNSVVQTID